MNSVSAWLLGAVAMVVCSGCSKKPQCFECGLSDEWARVESERKREQEREQERRTIGAAPPPRDVPPPIEAPQPGEGGCVSSAEVQAYIEALEQHADKTLAAALASAGARRIEREGFFWRNDGPAVLDEAYEANGKRFVIVGYMESTAKPLAVLARDDDARLHRIEPRARAHQVQLTVCGQNPCEHGRGARVHVLPVAVELEQGESVGEPLKPEYDTWWVFPAYTEHRDCGPPPP